MQTVKVYGERVRKANIFIKYTTEKKNMYRILATGRQIIFINN